MSPFRKLAIKFNKESHKPVAGKDTKAVNSLHGRDLPDPYRPLENLDSFTTALWVKAQNQRFAQFVSDVDGQDDLENTLNNIWNYETESLPARYGGRYFASYNDGQSSQSVYRVRDTKDHEPRTLIDPNKLSKDGTVALSGVFPSPDGKYVAYLTSEAGSDAQVLRVRDVETGQDLRDVIEDCRFTSLRWDHNSNEGFTYTYPAHDDLKRRIVKHHRIGDPIADDKIVFEVKDVANSSAFAGRIYNEDFEPSGYEYAGEVIGTNKANALYIKKPGKDSKFEVLIDDKVTTITPVAMVGGKLYAQTDYDAPQGRIVEVDLDNPKPQNWKTVVEPEGKDSLGWAMVHQGQLVVSYSHDTASKVSFYDLKGTHKHDMPLPPQSVAAFGKVNKNDDHYNISVFSFQSPPSQYKYDIHSNTLRMTKKSAAKVNLEDDVIVERIEATSKDGTKVPMTVIRRKDVELDGTAATKLYGYGGFNVPLSPGFSFGVYNWVSQGGIYVQANLRGGGEFGSDWYDQGRLMNKQNVFDDFIACAEHLIKNKYTKPARLNINGGSNGGLLTLATMLQRPDLFGAVTSHVPVTDMYRFHKFTYGAAWKSDYGDIEGNQVHFNAASKYSPLHNVKKDVSYPPTLVMTGDHDDRVVPSHAYKFVATMNEIANDNSLCLLRVEKDAGHGAGKPKEKVIREMVEEHAFLIKTLGPIDQKAYKATLKAAPKPIEEKRKFNFGKFFNWRR
jgi:prolyl oligopeptidase